ncbi:MAG: lysophospholipid acyltransferase family protein [Candidatus Promineifilaceae bacterium]
MTIVRTKADPDELARELMEAALDMMNLNGKRIRRRFMKSVLDRGMPRFAQALAEFDRRCAEDGLNSAINWILPSFRMKVTGYNAEKVPLEGPVLIASNHPGGPDFFSIFSQVPRNDARMVAAVDLIDMLPNVLPHVIYTSRTKGKKKERGATTRKMIAELQQGNCVLIYPRGKMEPDPMWSQGGIDCLGKWSTSITHFARAVPNLTIVPTVVAGSLERKAIEMRWLKLYNSERVRQRTAVYIQLAMSMARPDRWNPHSHVHFGEPIRVNEHAVDDVRPLVLGQMNELLTCNRAPDWPLNTRLTGWL